MASRFGSLPSGLNKRRLSLIRQRTIYGAQGPWSRRRCPTREFYMLRLHLLSRRNTYHHHFLHPGADIPRPRLYWRMRRWWRVNEPRSFVMVTVWFHASSRASPLFSLSPSGPWSGLQITLKQGRRALCHNWSLAALLYKYLLRANTDPGLLQRRHQIWPSKSASKIKRKDGSLPWSSLSHPGRP